MLEKLIEAMTGYERGCPQRVQHFIKVWGFARAIGLLEGLNAETQFTLEAAAIVHDIGIQPSLEKYGDADGKRQEAEGPPVAGPMLKALGFAEGVVERVCYLVGHHHTVGGIRGLDYQILVEADYLVNIYEAELPQSAVQKLYDEIFATGAGRRLCREMYLDAPAAGATD